MKNVDIDIEIKFSPPTHLRISVDKEWLKKEFTEFFRKASYHFNDRVQCDKITLGEVVDFANNYVDEMDE